MIAFEFMIPLSWEKIRDFSVKFVNISLEGSDGIASNPSRILESSAMHNVRISNPKHVAQIG